MSTLQQNCIACHVGNYKRFEKTSPKMNNSGVNHYEVLMNKTSCLNCHAEVGHKNRFYINPEFKKLWKEQGEK